MSQPRRRAAARKHGLSARFQDVFQPLSATRRPQLRSLTPLFLCPPQPASTMQTTMRSLPRVLVFVSLALVGSFLYYWRQADTLALPSLSLRDHDHVTSLSKPPPKLHFLLPATNAPVLFCKTLASALLHDVRRRPLSTTFERRAAWTDHFLLFAV